MRAAARLRRSLDALSEQVKALEADLAALAGETDRLGASRAPDDGAGRPGLDLDWE